MTLWCFGCHLDNFSCDNYLTSHSPFKSMNKVGETIAH